MSDDWTRTFYETPEARAILMGLGDDLDGAADRIAGWLELSPGDRVFDQCCGDGALSLALAARGFSVRGVDISGPFVAAAREAAAARGLDARFERADAYRYVTPERCGGGLSWGTGFGNGPDDAANTRMLACAAASLATGARFVLDYYNVAGALAGFRPELSYERRGPDGPVTVRRRSTLDLERGLMHQRWTFRTAGREVEMPRTTTRLYLAADLARLLGAAGFEVLRFFGDRAGGPLELGSPRCIALARRRPG